MLELAPASRLWRNRLLWLHRASPSATLDKKVFLPYNTATILSRSILSFLILFIAYKHSLLRIQETEKRGNRFRKESIPESRDALERVPIGSRGQNFSRFHGGDKNFTLPANFHFFAPAILGPASAKSSIDEPAKKPGIKLPGRALLPDMKRAVSDHPARLQILLEI